MSILHAHFCVNTIKKLFFFFFFFTFTYILLLDFTLISFLVTVSLKLHKCPRKLYTGVGTGSVKVKLKPVLILKARMSISHARFCVSTIKKLFFFTFTYILLFNFTLISFLVIVSLKLHNVPENSIPGKGQVVQR